MTAPDDSGPAVTEVVRLEGLLPGSRGARRAIARWSDGSEGTWYANEALICKAT